MTVFLLTLPLTLLAAIYQIHSIYESKKYFREAKTEILGIFDIDETLLIPEDPAFQKPNLKKHASIVQGIREQLPLEQQDLLSNLALLSSLSQLIESTAPLFIKDLQEQGIRLIALTAVMTRPFGKDFLPKIRYEELQRNGIDFSYAFPDIHELSLRDLKSCNQSFPLFYSGVLCSNGDHQRQKNATSKGEVLTEFLKHAAWTPSKVIFIDDKLYNLEEMERALHDFDPNISYQGLAYIGAQSIISPQISESAIENKWQELLEKAKFFIEESVKELCITND